MQELRFLVRIELLWRSWSLKRSNIGKIRRDIMRRDKIWCQSSLPCNVRFRKWMKLLQRSHCLHRRNNWSNERFCINLRKQNWSQMTKLSLLRNDRMLIGAKPRHQSYHLRQSTTLKKKSKSSNPITQEWCRNSKTPRKLRFFLTDMHSYFPFICLFIFLSIILRRTSWISLHRISADQTRCGGELLWSQSWRFFHDPINF